MIQNQFPNDFPNDAIARAHAQSEAILVIELSLINIECEIFTLSLDLESAQVAAEKAIAFDLNLKNEQQRKAALQEQLNEPEHLAKRKALQELKTRKAQAEAHLAAEKRLYQLCLIQAKRGIEEE